MTITRDELIADWRCRLADAEASEVSAPPRQAWLARIRIRLYRFLLSLYGSADWNADQAPPESSANRAVVFDSADALPLAGKPAKSAGKIRSVLKAVANAQDQQPTPGPLVHGLPDTSWIVVVGPNSGLDVHRYARLLTSHGIESRVRRWRGESLVKVRAGDRQAAFDLLEAHRDELLLPPAAQRSGTFLVRRFPRHQQVTVITRTSATLLAAPLTAAAAVLFFASPLIAWLCLIVVTTQAAPGSLPLRDLIATDEFLMIWTALAASSLLLGLLGVLRHKRPDRRSGPIVV